MFLSVCECGRSFVKVDTVLVSLLIQKHTHNKTILQKDGKDGKTDVCAILEGQV